MTTDAVTDSSGVALGKGPIGIMMVTIGTVGEGPETALGASMMIAVTCGDGPEAAPGAGATAAGSHRPRVAGVQHKQGVRVVGRISTLPRT
jgi:hypothetical protein